MTDDRRLIKDYLLIQDIRAEAWREKSVRKGHISALHLWWARQLFVAHEVRRCQEQNRVIEVSQDSG